MDNEQTLEDFYEFQPSRHDARASDSGVRWNLDDASFKRWWEALVPDDRNEFIEVYRGDDILARFVCALDHFTMVQGRAQTPGAIVEAYAIAAGLDPHSNECRIRASKAWKTDAVQAFLDRLRYRSARQASYRITSLTGLLIERMVQDALDPTGGADFKDRKMAADAATAFIKITSAEDMAERSERSKRGVEAARKALINGQGVRPTTEEAAMFLPILAEVLGPDMMKEALEKIALPAPKKKE